MNVPKLRFKEFNDEWKYEKLSSITNNISSGKISKKLVDGEYNVYGSMGIIGTSNFYDYDGEKVLVARVGANAGSVNKINEKCCISDNTLVLESNNILNDFLYFSLCYFNPKKLIFGSGQPLVTGSQLKNIIIGVPTILEQKKISLFMSLLDKKIELQSKKIEALKLYKKGLNNIIFQFEGEEKLIKDVIIEYNKRTSQNNQFEVLSSTMNGIAIQNNYFNKKQASEDTTGYKIVPNGYITYRSMSDTGEFHFNIQNITEVGIVSPAYPVFITTGEVDKIYFLNYLNENTNFKNSILENKEGGTRYALSFSKFKCLKIYLPNLATQKYFGGMISTINKKIIFEAKKLSKLESLKKGLMQSMFV